MGWKAILRQLCSVPLTSLSAPTLCLRVSAADNETNIDIFIWRSPVFYLSHSVLQSLWQWKTKWAKKELTTPVLWILLFFLSQRRPVPPLPPTNSYVLLNVHNLFTATTQGWDKFCTTFQVGRSSLEQTFRFRLIFAIEIAIFGPLGPWIDAWKGQIWP